MQGNLRAATGAPRILLTGAPSKLRLGNVCVSRDADRRRRNTPRRLLRESERRMRHRFCVFSRSPRRRWLPALVEMLPSLPTPPLMCYRGSSCDCRVRLPTPSLPSPHRPLLFAIAVIEPSASRSCIPGCAGGALRPLPTIFPPLPSDWRSLLPAMPPPAHTSPVNDPADFPQVREFGFQRSQACEEFLQFIAHDIASRDQVTTTTILLRQDG